MPRCSPWFSARVVVGLVLVAALTPPGSARADDPVDPAPAQASSGIYLTANRVGSDTDSFRQMVLQSYGPGSANTEAEVEEVLGSLLARARAGEDLDLPNETSEGSRADVAVLEATLAAVRRGEAEPAFASAADADPNNYTRTGFKTNQGRTWRIPSYGQDQYYCDAPGDCELRDSYNLALTVDPGRNSDRISYTATYFPRSSPRLLEDIYVVIGNYTQRGVDLGDREVRNSTIANGGGSGVVTLAHDPATGRNVQNLFRLHIYNVIRGAEYRLRVRTGLARCGTGSNLNCIYP